MGAGTESLFTGRAASPERAAQAAAGMANAASLARVEHHVVRRPPARGREEAVHRRRPARRRRRPPPRRSCSPLGRATSSPTRITCASFARSDPRGSSRSSVSAVAAGRELPSDRRMGAPIGGPDEHGGGHGGLPVVLVHEHHRGGAIGLAGGGEERIGHAGGVRGGVAAADAHGVAGGREGEAELLGGLVVAALRARPAGPRVVVAEAATGDRGPWRGRRRVWQAAGARGNGP